ncbi:MAG: NTP transferase domain-containing protein [Bacteroidota bacterium]
MLQGPRKIHRPAYGSFSRNEWAIIGAPSDLIQQLAYGLSASLSEHYRLGYVDADPQSPQTALAYGSTLEYTDKATFHRLDFKAPLNRFQLRPLFNDQDAVLVNGNHFRAKKQIVIIDPRGEASLRKRLDHLTDVSLFLLTEEMTGPYAFLKKSLPHWADIPTMAIEELPLIAELLGQHLKAAQPPLSGLVLAGGYSQRMGRDKGLIDYHGRPQREYMQDQLASFCVDTWLSCRPEQQAKLSAFKTIPDTFIGLGPFGALLSAFRERPDHAWLVTAVDLPLLDEATLQQLTEGRNPSKVATAFRNPATDSPDPLLTIWEPRSYPVLLQFLAQGYASPRKVLLNSPIERLEPRHPQALTNVNSPEEYARIIAQLQGGKHRSR